MSSEKEQGPARVREAKLIEVDDARRSVKLIEVHTGSSVKLGAGFDLKGVPRHNLDPRNALPAQPPQRDHSFPTTNPGRQFQPKRDD